MIENGTLVYGREEPVLQAWELSADIPNVLLIAFLSTLLSYQATAIFFDLFLGIKQRRLACLSDLHTLLLVRQSSPLAVATNLFRKDWLTRQSFNLAPYGPPIARDPDHVRVPVAIKLLLLLSVAPLVNICAIVLTLEDDDVLTFEDARFGGIALGINDDFSVVEMKQLTAICEYLPVNLARGEKSAAEFSICEFGSGFRHPELQFTSEVSLYSVSDITLRVEVIVHGLRFTAERSAYLHTNGHAFNIRHRVTREDALALVDRGLELLASLCQFAYLEEAIDVTNSTIAGSLEGGSVLAAKSFLCVDPEERSDVKVGNALVDLITFINAEDVIVVPPDQAFSKSESVPDPPFFNAKDFPLLTRRRRNLSLGMLAILTAAVVLLRLTTGVIFHNDVDLGLEVLMKKSLGFGCCESILYTKDAVVVYNAKCEPGRIAFYGDSEADSPLVEYHSEGLSRDAVDLDEYGPDKVAHFSMFRGRRS